MNIRSSEEPSLINMPDAIDAPHRVVLESMGRGCQRRSMS